jgi:hypothetical protein
MEETTMTNLNNVTVGMQCSGGTILVTGASGKILNSQVLTVTSTDWIMPPTPNVGRDYYVIEDDPEQSWLCNCTDFENNTATFSMGSVNPC